MGASRRQVRPDLGALLLREDDDVTGPRPWAPTVDRDRLYAWSVEHPGAGDTVLAVALPVVLAVPTEAVMGLPSLLLSLGLLLPLAWRRTRPVASAAAVLGTAGA